jgi:hypothetical protein
LHLGVIPRMYEGLTVNTPGCVAFSLPVQRRNLRFFSGFPASFRSLPSQCSARLTWSGGFEPERRSVPGYHLGAGTTVRHGITEYRAARLRYAMAGERFGATPGLQRQTRRRFLPPTCSDGPTLDAPDCVADHDPARNRADAERKLCASLCSARNMFGAALWVAFWPSPHPRIRWTVASPGRAICAHRDTRPPPSRAQKCPTKC